MELGSEAIQTIEQRCIGRVEYSPITADVNLRHGSESGTGIHEARLIRTIRRKVRYSNSGSRISPMSTRQVHVFISHAWAFSDHYNTLADWIFGGRWSVGQASLDFRDYSVPRDDPIHHARNQDELKEAIFNRISRSHVVVVPTGMYASYSRWIQKELSGANLYSKPILAVVPWGQQRNSKDVSDEAHETVGWNKESIINAIWRLYQADNA